VLETGKEVTRVKAGDKVIASFIPACGLCFHCLRDESNLCEKSNEMMIAGRGVRPDGSSVFGMTGLGTFADLMMTDEASLVKVDTDLPSEQLALIGCGVTTGVGAVINTAKVQVGDTVVVFGLGGIGLNVVQGARIAGARMIAGVDLNPARRAIAEKFGLTHFVNPAEVRGDLVPYLVDLTGGGADFAFECIGNVKLMRQALECCHRGWGTCVIIGVAAAGEEISTRPFQLVTGRTWKGTAFGGARGRRDVPRIVDWYMEGKINIDDLITHTMPLDRINEAFDLMHRGESIRTVVTF
jgi:S-(hydroxymethyl)glutathione dehydrogenase/alcohol dehydrogenase